ncbi:MAG TPA: bifunctional UDP-N-acetylglucosamine diphosphorylase/glucosamine-1-phosphate N-acetyltransferase GlmU [Nitrosospira sp.]|nr:bifunctional UDP-N-acetylglucosamine diphosphorylase/glucosamine-1-phosphate N-acetyltransferase GlmU [Nitrosospira sp.]
MSELNIVILAAGLGKRMRSPLPKVLHPLAGKPLLRHVLETARGLSPKRICVVYGHGGETVPQAIADDTITWVLQSPQLGTGHAVMQALSHLDRGSKTLVLYGDVPLTSVETLRELLAAAEPENLALLTVELDDPTGYGRILRNEEGVVVAIVEEKDASEQQRGIREINTGIMVIPNRHLHEWLHKLENNNAQKEYYLTDIVARAAGDGVAIKTAQPAHAWETVGVNSKAQLVSLERVYQHEYAKNLLDKGVTLADMARIDVRGQLDCGTDVEIDVGCIFEGNVRLEDGVKVGAYTILKNVRIAAGSTIAPFSLIEAAEIGKNCRVGPYARIRPDTVLADDVHVGNFVEVKKSTIAAGSKANHLSYIGDSIIGRNVNIGAGTITCNYDGANKYQTIIEDDVFVGSDTQLVAPVTVSRGSTIGAGSTITRDTPAEKLTLSRVRQTSIEGWTRPVKGAQGSKGARTTKGKHDS